MSYQKLEVWQLAKELTIEIHQMSLTLPDFEKYEEGQQIRRSIKSVRSTLVEGYGRRQYKADYIKFIVYALSSTDETIDHLDTLFETGSLKNQEQFLGLKSRLEKLSKKLNNFLKAVQEKHETPAFINKVKEPLAAYQNQESANGNRESAVNPWTTLSSEEKYDNRWINVTEFQVINPAGGKGIYGKIHFKNKAIGIVPIDEEGNTWLVGQWRYPLNEWSWEIPEGGGPLEKDALDSAKRELKEETGMTANRWTMIQRVHLSNSVSDEEGFIFMAEELMHGESELEETEADLKLWKLPFQEALQMVLDGKITDSLSVLGILKVARIKKL
jgi:four helix bundle protein